MFSKHLAFTAHRNIALFAIVVDSHFMLLAYFLLRLLLYKLIYNTNQLVDKSVAAGHHIQIFDIFATIRAFRFELQALSYTRLAVKLRTIRTHHGSIYMAKTYMTS